MRTSLTLAAHWDDSAGMINRRRPVPVPTAKKSIAVRLLALWVGLTFVIPGFTAPLLERPGLVSTEWLAERIGHPDLRILDARVSLRSYLGGHVPGAVYLNTETIRISRGGIPASLLPPEQIAEILGHIGLANHHTVVIYSSADEAFSHAAYVAFLLEWLGHQAIGVVDGGIEIKTWKSPAELRTLAAALGADGSQPIMTYCTSGRESAQLWFTLRHVARLPNVSSYHGSWIDWTARGLPAAGAE